MVALYTHRLHTIRGFFEELIEKGTDGQSDSRSWMHQETDLCLNINKLVKILRVTYHILKNEGHLCNICHICNIV